MDPWITEKESVRLWNKSEFSTELKNCGISLDLVIRNTTFHIDQHNIDIFSLKAKKEYKPLVFESSQQSPLGFVSKSSKAAAAAIWPVHKTIDNDSTAAALQALIAPKNTTACNAGCVVFSTYTF